VLSNDKWVSLNSPGYCFYNNNIGSVNSYGLLYNGYVLDSNICPVGWHIPNEKEWIALAQEFDKIYSLNKLDTSRVKKLQGHRRGLNGQYYTFEGNSLFEGNGPWWCSSNSEAIGWNRFLDYVHISYRNESYRECGNSIRCVKD
jgi:uncharacterized protein (TIGR02145 family)